jgi:hypothetical protein
MKQLFIKNITLFAVVIAMLGQSLPVFAQTPDFVGQPKDSAVALDTTQRIAMWPGKVNQHINTTTGIWESDPDGVSGGNRFELYSSDYSGREGEYCKKWYPNTNAVLPYKIESINTWRDAGNTGGPYTNNVQSYKCINTSNTATVVDPWCAQFSDGKPRIKVLSPNGGESYQTEQYVTTNWISCNISKNANVGVGLTYNGTTSGTIALSDLGTTNSGATILQIANATTLSQVGYNLGKNFKMHVLYYDTNSSAFIRGESENLFTINNKDTVACTRGTDGTIYEMQNGICVAVSAPALDTTPRIAMWGGKVNQHINTTTGI